MWQASTGSGTAKTMMTVHVQNLAGSTETHSVASTASVAELKNYVAERLSVTPSRLRLVLRSQAENGLHAQLDEETRTLSSYGVGNETTLHIFIESLGPHSAQFERASTPLGSGVGEFKNPKGICLLGDALFCADSGNHRIVVLNALDLSFRFAFGSEGRGDGQLSRPTGVCASGDLLFVADENNRRVVVFRASDGAFVRCSAALSGAVRGICASASGEWLCVRFPWHIHS